MVEIWFAIVGATLVFALLAWWFMHRTTARADAQAAERERLLQRELELEQRALARELEHRFKQRETELEQRHERRQIELRQKEDEAVSALLAAEKEKDLLEKRRASLDEQITEAEAREDAARERLAEYRHKLLKLAEAAVEDARAADRE